MKELKEIIRDIREKLEDAEKYAKEAVKHKERYKSLADTYAQIAQDDMRQADMLHRHATDMIETKERSGAETPASMRTIWEYEHEQEVDKAMDVRRLLDMYKS